jgi:HK97 family phage major capsid protein
MSIKALRDQHAAIVAEARKILEAAEFTGDREAEFDKRMADADAIAKRIEREEQLANAEARTAARIAEAAEKVGKSESQVADDAQAYANAFRDYCRFGMEGVGPEYRELFKRGYSSVDTRAQSVTGGSPVGIYGGYTVPEGFFNELERAMKAYGGMLETGRVITTATGNDLPMPYSDDTGNSGAILGENQPITEQDVTFGVVTLGAYKYTSKLIRVSYELLQDSAFNMESFIAEVAGERLGRVLNSHFTTGNGTSQPQGVVTGAAAGVTGQGSTVLTYNDIVDLQHSVDPAYRRNARFMFNDSTLKALRKIKDSEGRPLWQPDVQGGIAGTLIGVPYTINQDMASIGLSAKSVLYGDFSHYFIRRVRDFTLVRLNERYADNLQVGFFVYCRFDAKLKNAGQNPIKYLVHPAASP